MTIIEIMKSCIAKEKEREQAKKNNKTAGDETIETAQSPAAEPTEPTEQSESPTEDNKNSSMCYEEFKRNLKLAIVLKAMAYDYSRDNGIEGFDRKINNLVLHGVKFIQHKTGYRIEPIGNVDHYERIRNSLMENAEYQAALIEILRDLPEMAHQQFLECNPSQCIFKKQPFDQELSFWCYLSNCKYAEKKFEEMTQKKFRQIKAY